MTDPPRRVNFADGLMLTAEDLATEQEYHRSMRYLHNRLHGPGVAFGLEVTAAGKGVHVGPGMAIDGHGREIVLNASRRIDLAPLRASPDGACDLVAVWAEVPDRPVPGPDGSTVFTRWVEQPQLTLVAPGEAPADALVLARLTRSRRGAISVEPGA